MFLKTNRCSRGCGGHGRLRIADLSIGRLREKVGSGLWIDVLVQLVANHANWRGAAAGQALDKLDAVISVGADRDRIMHSFTITRALDSQTSRTNFPSLRNPPAIAQLSVRQSRICVFPAGCWRNIG